MDPHNSDVFGKFNLCAISFMVQGTADRFQNQKTYLEREPHKNRLVLAFGRKSIHYAAHAPFRDGLLRWLAWNVFVVS